MGTSSPSSGSGSDTSLVPTWLDEPSPDDGMEDDGQTTQSDNEDDQPKPPIIPAPQPNRFRSGRVNFSKFAGSSGRDLRALRRAVRDYVRYGTNGSANATKRMKMSRVAAQKILNIFRGIERDGVQKTLRSLNLKKFEGCGIQEIFIGLTESICRNGGIIDEAIPRNAWMETIIELLQSGISDLDSLSSDQIQEVFLIFISHTIEERLYLEIGVNGFKYTENMKDIDELDGELRVYIKRSVEDSFERVRAKSGLTKVSEMSDRDIQNIVDKTYLNTWDLLELRGDRE